MFNLLTIVIAIILMVAFAIAGLVFLGPAFKDTKDKADLATYLNQGAQIHGALALYKAQNGGQIPPGTDQEKVQALIDGQFLQTAPNLAAKSWSITEGTVFRDLNDAGYCARLNKAAREDMSSPEVQAYDGCPPCSETKYASWPACRRQQVTSTTTTNDPNQSVGATGSTGN